MKQKTEDFESFYRDFYKNSPDVLISINPETCEILQCNNAFYKITNFTEEDVIGKIITNFYDEESQKKLDGALITLKEKGRVNDIAIFAKNKDGELIPVILSITCITDERGNITEQRIIWKEINFPNNHYNQAQAFNADLYTQKQNLEITSQRLNAILDSAVDGIITIDAQGIIETINPAVEKIFGYTSSELLGKNIKVLMPEDYAKHHDQYLRNYLSTRKAQIIGIGREVVGLRKNGSTFPLELAVSEMKIDGVSKFTGIIRDITERKKIEDNLHEAYKELEAFTYIASHDLKEPLRGIYHYATFLIEDYAHILDDSGKDKLRAMKEMAIRMNEFIDSLLNFSRISHQKDKTSLVDLNKLIQEVLDLLKVSLKEKNAKIMIKDNFPSISCNKIGVREVFQNLIMNSLKYNDKENIVIEIGIGPIDNKSSLHTFYIRDNGIGIEKKYFDSIFRIFKRLHQSNMYGGGTGAGLTIVKKVIEQHRGKIWLDSIPGQGTTFYFSLPVEQEE